jgi:hypothetical protein
MRNTNCISCGKTLTPALSGDWKDDPPWAATIFTAGGNYGSTIWDPFLQSGAYLKIAICDPCLTNAAKRDRVIHVQPVKSPATEEKVWKIDEND